MASGEEGEGPDRALAGIGRFSAKLAIGTVLAIGLAAIGLRVVSRGPPSTPVETTPGPSARPPTGAGARAPAGPEPLPSAVTAAGRAVDARHEAGGLSDAQRTFDACPGGDLRRVAWIDGEGRVFRLSRHRADGWRVDTWYDERGRLREALLRRGGAADAWRRRVAVDDRGRETVLEEAGAVPDVPPPDPVRADPAAAFFATEAGCRPGGR